jgi:hypothetical protein
MTLNTSAWTNVNLSIILQIAAYLQCLFFFQGYLTLNVILSERRYPSQYTAVEVYTNRHRRLS